MNSAEAAVYVSIGSAVIALAAVGVNYWQYRAARAKIKLDLFEQRYAIFEAVWKILRQQAKEGAEGLAGYHELGHIEPRAEFLFGSEIGHYLRIVRHQLFSRECLSPDEDPSSAMENYEYHNIKKWLRDEAEHGVRERFEPYLSFGKLT